MYCEPLIFLVPVCLSIWIKCIVIRLWCLHQMSPLGCSSQQWYILLVASLISHLPCQENSIFVRLVRCTIFKISYKFPYNSYSPCSTACLLSNKQMLLYRLWEDSWKKGHSYLNYSPLVFFYFCSSPHFSPSKEIQYLVLKDPSCDHEDAQAKKIHKGFWPPQGLL